VEKKANGSGGFGGGECALGTLGIEKGVNWKLISTGEVLKNNGAEEKKEVQKLRSYDRGRAKGEGGTTDGETAFPLRS